MLDGLNWIRSRLFGKEDGSVGDVAMELAMGRIFFDKPSWKWRRVKRGFSIGKGRRLNPHMVIVGESGSGKSNACKVIVQGLAEQGVNLAILDPHNEYLGIADRIGATVYDAAYNGINIFELDGVGEKEKANELTSMFRRVFRLGDVQGYQLYRCIMFAYKMAGSRGNTPTIHDLMYTIQVFKRHAKSAGDTRILDGLARRLSLIDSGAFSRSTDMGKVMNGRSVFLLSGLHTNEAQSVYIEGFMRKVYGRMLAMEKSGIPRFYVAIDEAEKLGQKSVAGKIAAEGRKYGVGLIAMAQRAKSIDKEIRSNASLFMTFYQREPEELNYLANLVSGGNELNRFAEVKRVLRNLHRGSALVLDSLRPNPFVVRFGKSDDNGICVAYQMVSAARGAISRNELFEMMRNLGLSEAQVEGQVAKALADQTLSEHTIDSGSRYDGKWYIAMPRNSAEHDVCVNVIKRHLEAMGLRASVYNSAYGPDVIAFLGKERIAVEYETGMKSLESTQKMLKYRAGVYPNIIVVVNDSRYPSYSGIADAHVARLSDFLKSERIASGD